MTTSKAYNTTEDLLGQCGSTEGININACQSAVGFNRRDVQLWVERYGVGCRENVNNF